MDPSLGKPDVRQGIRGFHSGFLSTVAVARSSSLVLCCTVSLQAVSCIALLSACSYKHLSYHRPLQLTTYTTSSSPWYPPNHHRKLLVCTASNSRHPRPSVGGPACILSTNSNNGSILKFTRLFAMAPSRHSCPLSSPAILCSPPCSSVGFQLSPPIRLHGCCQSFGSFWLPGSAFPIPPHTGICMQTCGPSSGNCKGS